MIHAAIVEDTDEDAKALHNHLLRYAKEKGIAITVRRFHNAIAFLDPYQAAYQLVFMDIQMPYMNGMDAAHRLRELDPDVLLIFTTNLSQYALAGYDVQAANYLVKPLRYHEFSLKLEIALRRLTIVEDNLITLRTDMGIIRISPSSIRYVEVAGHHVTFHTINGDVVQYGSMSSAAAMLDKRGFSLCNRCYLVNLQYVKAIKGYEVLLDNGSLRISQPRKKEFLQAYEAYNIRQKE